MTETSAETEERTLLEARAQGPLATLRAFLRLSGPGWLQSAITLGGGSLASALYLGVLSGFHLLWLQIVAMLLGIVMLAAIGYVTLSTGKRPFRAINEHISPVLGWGWIIAVMLANVVWCLPQFALGSAAIQQNLIPSLSGTSGTVISCALILGLSSIVIWFYDSGTRGIRIFEIVLKVMVALVVLCFFGVVLTLATSEAGLPWESIASGLIPDLSFLSSPAPVFTAFLSESPLSEWWSARIVSEQQDVMVAAAATAVGINMTFLLPYSMLRKGWGRAHRGLAVFDLGTALLIPFALATSCVVIVAASQFHGQADESLVHDPLAASAHPSYLKTLDARLLAEFGSEEHATRSVAPDLAHSLGQEAFQARVATTLQSLPLADRQLAAMLQKRDAFSLAASLEPLTGRTVSQVVFGLGVLSMAISTVIILMLISGFTFCEMFGLEPRGTAHRVGALFAGVVGFFGPFIWKGDAKFWLAVPTSNFGMVLLPIAYWTFFLMMNSKGLLGEHRPRGRKRVIWNTLMILSASTATFASLATLQKNLGVLGLQIFAGFLALAVAVHVLRGRR
jgi:Mn2+/Fe2+ NRAMP family transporter